ncbi:MAG TPA: hypothetical protein VIR78_15390, partial [Malonomonas sp.]
MFSTFNANTILPADATSATLVGRAWVPGNPSGPAVVLVRDGDVIDITPSFSTVSALLESHQLLQWVRNAAGTRLGSVDELLANTSADARNSQKPYLIAPVDLQAIKACGVT